jgi:hypothetical protein
VSAGGAVRSRCCQIWAHFRSNPLQECKVFSITVYISHIITRTARQGVAPTLRSTAITSTLPAEFLSTSTCRVSRFCVQVLLIDLPSRSDSPVWLSLISASVLRPPPPVRRQRRHGHSYLSTRFALETSFVGCMLHNPDLAWHQECMPTVAYRLLGLEQ